MYCFFCEMQARFLSKKGLPERPVLKSQFLIFQNSASHSKIVTPGCSHDERQQLKMCPFVALMNKIFSEASPQANETDQNTGRDNRTNRM